MKTDIRDVETFEAIEPTTVKAYLRARGWTQTGHFGENGEIWTSDEQQEEVLLPLDRSLTDYGLNMAELIGTVADVEARGELAVVRDIASTQSDRVRLRFRPSNGAPGTLPFENAVDAVTHARDLMMSAACAAVDPREYYPSRKFDDAKDYVRQLKMGQTEEGSFVLTILSPVAPRLRDSSDDGIGDGAASQLDFARPFEREVTITLMEALSAADAAAREALTRGELEPFERAVSEGVSANLCDALLGLSGDERDLPFDVELAWASNRGSPEGVADRVAFSPDRLPVFDEVSRVFKSKSPREAFELEGAIIRLQREGDEGPGTIRVMGAVDNRSRKVEVELDEATFERAIEAFRNHVPVRVLGELHRAGRTYRLKHPRGFELLPDREA